MNIKEKKKKRVLTPSHTNFFHGLSSKHFPWPKGKAISNFQNRVSV